MDLRAAGRAALAPALTVTSAASVAITVLVADDEPLARDRMRRLLVGAGCASVLSASDGPAALAAIEAHRPQVAFLDIQMPGLTGLDLVRQLAPQYVPRVVFVTAYEEFAARAFDAEAVDYLVKPYEDARFIAAYERALRRLAEGAAPELGARVVESPSGRLERIVIRTGSRLRLVRAHDVEWIEADGVYARVHVDGRSSLLRMSLTELESRLDPATFIRVHRSAIVNLDRVVELRESSRGEYSVVLQGGLLVKLSRARRAALRERLGQPL
ncbi:MAG: two component transcriptional regulator, LytTR family [Gemmatimonadetes bacterium]|nr:two component transcriptional regulator, LytTR family [Gemmatimonadota bacterium]